MSFSLEFSIFLEFLPWVSNIVEFRGKYLSFEMKMARLVGKYWFFSHKNAFFSSKCCSFQHNFWVLLTKFATKWGCFFWKKSLKNLRYIEFSGKTLSFEKGLEFCPLSFAKTHNKKACHAVKRSRYSYTSVTSNIHLHHCFCYQQSHPLCFDKTHSSPNIVKGQAFFE